VIDWFHGIQQIAAQHLLDINQASLAPLIGEDFD
jgi:hypothetical protein